MRWTSRNKVLLLQLAAVLLFTAIALLFFRERSTDPSGSSKSQDASQTSATIGSVNVFQKTETQPGLTLYPEVGTAQVLLLTLEGKLVHTWNVDADRARLLPNGHLLVIHGSKWGRKNEPWRTKRNEVTEYDWDGNAVWQYQARDVAHHDVHRLPNGNTLFPIRAIVPLEAQEKIADMNIRRLRIRSDSILEITPEGTVAWAWHAHEHLDMNSCGERGCEYLLEQVGASTKAHDWTHINTAIPLPENKWFEDGDLRFRPGNLVLMPRNWWTVLIIDRETGKVVWSYRGDFGGGIGGGHEPHMIPKGFPGAGNILLFDNGSTVHPEESYILEIDPLSKNVVWSYAPGKSFFSASRGAVQRLRNGNTLISEDRRGRCFEVNSDGTIIWEYKGRVPSSRCFRYEPGFCRTCDEAAKEH